MTTLCSVGVSCTTVTGHDINFDAGKKKEKFPLSGRQTTGLSEMICARILLKGDE